jgi:hypothetical protein
VTLAIADDTKAASTASLISFDILISYCGYIVRGWLGSGSAIDLSACAGLRAGGLEFDRRFRLGTGSKRQHHAAEYGKSDKLRHLIAGFELVPISQKLDLTGSSSLPPFANLPVVGFIRWLRLGTRSE